MRLSNFTIHAAQRLCKRTTMSIYELNSMLEAGSCVNMGNKTRINKEHHLFYSLKDKAFFVAVIDSLLGSVITVLPLAYHENLGWPVSVIEKNKAKALASTHVFKPIEEQAEKKYWVSVGYLNEENSPKVAFIGKVSVEEFERDSIWAFADKNKTVRFLTEKIKEKTGGNYTAQWVAFKIGKNGQATAVDLACA